MGDASDLMVLPATLDSDASTIDLGPIALAIYGFNDAFTATTALILTASVVGLRLLALAVAIGRARASNQLRPLSAAGTTGGVRASRVEKTQLLAAQPSKARSDDQNHTSDGPAEQAIEMTTVHE